MKDTDYKIGIRRLEAGDIDAIAAIQGKILRKRVSVRWRNMAMNYLKRSGDSCFVATDGGGRVAGFIMGEVKEYGFGLERTGWIEIVGVDPEHMGSGIGRRLGERLIRHFREKGAVEVHTTAPWDAGDILTFFKSLGFERSEFINLVRKL